MKFLIQVVNNASVHIVEKNITNNIEKGLLIYVGVSNDDINNYSEKIDKFVNKIGSTKFFHNIETHKIDQSINDINGQILLISNFTLYGSNKKGTKLDFTDSAGYEDAKRIYEDLIEKIKQHGIQIKTGEFGAMMLVDSQNDGPINIILEY
ncbi:MAG: D-aminoacyl-tRNA deacylase [Candidatus Absconditicoccaceae bacterium]